MATPTKPTAAEKHVGREAAKKAKARAGAGWDLLGADLQEALIAREVVGVLLSQITVEGEDMHVMKQIARVAYAAGGR